MLHILLLILKIIGITLLSLLVVALLLILLVLFVPVRYEIKCSMLDGANASVKANWMLCVLRFRFVHEKDGTKSTLRIFGYNILNRKKKVKRKKQKKDISFDDDEDIGLPRSEPEEITGEIKPEILIDKTSESADDTVSEKSDTISDKKPKKKQKAKRVKKESLIKRIKRKYHSIIRSIKQIIQNIKLMLSNGKEFVAYILGKEFGDSLSFVKKELIMLIMHIRPKKHWIVVKFGTGSPDLTGKILGAIAVANGYAGLNLSVTPDFNNTVFEGELYAKGRIRLLKILLTALRLYKNEQLKNVMNRFRK